MSNSIDGFRELIKTYEGDKLPWVHVHLDDGKELLAHIERLEAKVKRFEQAGIRWRKEQVEETFDQWIEDVLTDWFSDEDAAWQAWMYVHEWKVFPMMKRIERLESALALAEKAIGGECDIANNCDLCQAYQAIQDIKSGGSLGAAAGKTDEEQEGI